MKQPPYSDQHPLQTSIKLTDRKGNFQMNEK